MLAAALPPSFSGQWIIFRGSDLGWPAKYVTRQPTTKGARHFAVKNVEVKDTGE